jgi:hypothetical protein
VGPGLHFDYRSDAILFDARDHAREPVPRGLRGDRPFALAPICLESAEVGERDETLAAR